MNSNIFSEKISISEQIISDFRSNYEKDIYECDDDLIQAYKQILHYLNLTNVITKDEHSKILVAIMKEFRRFKEWY